MKGFICQWLRSLIEGQSVMLLKGGHGGSRYHDFNSSPSAASHRQPNRDLGGTIAPKAGNVDQFPEIQRRVKKVEGESSGANRRHLARDIDRHLCELSDRIYQSLGKQ